MDNMDIETYLYLIFLFVVFTPGIVFSIPSSSSSSKWVRVFTHGFLFSVAWLLTYNIHEGVTTTAEGTTIVDYNSTTTYTPPPPKPLSPYPDLLSGPIKCHEKYKFCVTTQGHKPTKTLNYYCMGKTNGCAWGNGDDGKCSKDSDCDKFNVNTSKKYVESDCSKVNYNDPNGWPAWVCKNTVHPDWKKAIDPNAF